MHSALPLPSLWPASQFVHSRWISRTHLKIWTLSCQRCVCLKGRVVTGRVVESAASIYFHTPQFSPPTATHLFQGPPGYHDRMASAAAQHAATGKATMYSFSGAELPRSAYSMEAAQPPSNVNEPVRRRRNLQATGSNGVGRHLTQAGLGPPATSNGEMGCADEYVPDRHKPSRGTEGLGANLLAKALNTCMQVAHPLVIPAASILATAHPAMVRDGSLHIGVSVVRLIEADVFFLLKLANPFINTYCPEIVLCMLLRCTLYCSQRQRVPLCVCSSSGLAPLHCKLLGHAKCTASSSLT